MTDVTKPKVVKTEVRFVQHIPETENNPDMLYIKEALTLDNNSIVPKIRIVENFNRPIWVTAPQYRDHREKKEFESTDRLQVKECTDSELSRTIALMLDQQHLANRPDLLKFSPFVYGGDISAAAYYKYLALQKNDFVQSKYSVGALDLETSTNKGDRDIYMGSIAMFRNGKLHIRAGYIKSWYPDNDAVQQIKTKFDELLPQYKDKYHLDVLAHDTQVGFIRDIFKYANKWAPDFLSIWNIKFDIGEVILPILLKAGIDPKDVICDLRLPSHLRHFEFIPGRTMKVMASGKKSPIPLDMQWQKVKATTTFQLIDSMRVYRLLRIPFGRDPSYALDAILAKEGIDGKLKSETAKHLNGVSWHIHMAEKEKATYCIYNFVDNIRLLELDAKVNDLSLSLPIFTGIAPFVDFASSTIKNYHNLFMYGLTVDQIIGTMCDIEKMHERYSKDPNLEGRDVYHYKTFGRDGWTETLPQGNFVRQGLQFFKDFPYIVTNARGYAVDLDAVSAYPSAVIAANVSRATTYTEVIEVQGMSLDEVKQLQLGAIIGNTNSIEYCNRMFSITSLEEVANMIHSGKMAEMLKAANEEKAKKTA